MLAIIGVMVTLVMTAVAIVVAVVAIVIAPFFAAVIVTALGAIVATGPLNFLGVGVAVCYLYQLLDGCRPLVV
jgi:hypothetical protein